MHSIFIIIRIIVTYLSWNVQMSNICIFFIFTDSSFETGAIFGHACWVSLRTTMSVCLSGSSRLP